MKKRKAYDDNIKVRVALEAIKGEKMISEIASKFVQEDRATDSKEASSKGKKS